ncbi:MAG: DUF1292 domain-containing protein [Bacilli bacterium]|nr:DUF1292 domain-containing protein [Bacilli bacterium]MBR3049772.1 DUF1292 domain-containing protein [Bacilli bacterium]
MDRFIEVTTEDGKKHNAEVIQIFNVDLYPNKDYIMYSFGEKLGDQEKVYISILEEINDTYNLKGISDPREWAIVQDTINNTIEDMGDIDG